MKRETVGRIAAGLMMVLAVVGLAQAQQVKPGHTTRPGSISDRSEDWLDARLTGKGVSPSVRADAQAQIRRFTCADPRTGAPIAITGVAGMDNLAQARRLPDNRLVIEFNPQYMTLFQAPTVLFWLEHECEHHQLGHTLDAGGALSEAQRAAEEDAADCAAAKYLMTGDAPKLGAQGLAAIIADVAKLKGGDFYRSGAARARWIQRCAGAG